MDNSGLFAEIFKDYKKPPKDAIGKLSDAYASYQDFIAPKNELERNIQGMIEQWNPAGVGMVAGQNVAKQIIKKNPKYLAEVRDAFANLKSIPKELLRPVSNDIPGLYRGDLYSRPEVKELYDRTNIVMMPYMIPNSVTGKLMRPYGIDLGRGYLKPQNMDQVRDYLSKGEKVKLGDVMEFPAKGILDEAYGPKWLDNITVASDPNAPREAATLGDATMRYHPMGRTLGQIDIANPDTLDNFGLLENVLNHEGTHIVAGLGGLPLGSNTKLFNTMYDSAAAAPVGLEKAGAANLYNSDLGEIMARASESESDNLIDAIINNMPTNKSNMFGVNTPVVIKSKLQHPNPAYDYGLGGEHFGYDLRDWVGTMGYGWDTLMKKLY